MAGPDDKPTILTKSSQAAELLPKWRPFTKWNIFGCIINSCGGQYYARKADSKTWQCEDCDLIYHEKCEPSSEPEEDGTLRCDRCYHLHEDWEKEWKAAQPAIPVVQALALPAAKKGSRGPQPIIKKRVCEKYSYRCAAATHPLLNACVQVQQTGLQDSWHPGVEGVPRALHHQQTLQPAHPPVQW